MSAPTLPLEILDLIFDLVQPKSSLPTGKFPYSSLEVKMLKI